MKHVLSLLLAVVCLTTASADLVIMPIGDSHTSGYHGTPAGSYRPILSSELSTQGIGNSFVGDYFLGGAHQGLAGASIEYMTDNYGPSVATYDPDIALVLAGTNNHWQTPDLDVFTQKYGDLFDMITTNAPGVKIIVATVPKFAYGRPDTSYWTDEFVDNRNLVTFPNMNAALRAAALARDNVSVVDLYSALDIDSDYAPDAVHMNLYGQQKLANLFGGEILVQVPEPNSMNLLWFVLIVIYQFRYRTTLASSRG